MAPHAETDPPASQPKGTDAPSPPSPSSYKSLTHLKSYPLIADSLSTLSAHPIGQRTISLSTSAYTRLISPLSPYLSKAEPYVTRADSFADSQLHHIDARFPIVKEPSSVVVGYPRKVVAEVIVRGTDFARERQEYVLKVYEDECEKAGGGDGVVPRAKAGVATGLVVSSELMGAIAGYLKGKGEEAEKKVNAKKEEAEKKANTKKEEVEKKANTKKEEAKNGELRGVTK